MKLWVDDLRDPEDWNHPGWVWVKTADIAIDYLRMGDVTEISLDHDLGDWDEDQDPLYNEKTGYTVVIWMAENEVWPVNGARAHSANPIGYDRIMAVIERYGPYGKET